MRPYEKPAMQVRVLIAIILLLIPLQLSARQPISVALYAGGEIHDVDYQFSSPLNFDPEDDGDSYGVGITYAISFIFIKTTNKTRQCC